MTEVTWMVRGQYVDGMPHARTTQVPDGEDYADWIAQAWKIERSTIAILHTEKVEA